MKKKLSKFLLLIILFASISTFSQSKILQIQTFYKKNSPAKTSKTITFNKNSKVITIDGNRIPLTKVSFHYEFNDKYYNYAHHFVSVDCLDDSECVKSVNGSHIGLSVPLNSKQNALKFITMLENL